MSGTPRYNQPEKGSQNWHEPLNENFANIGVEMDAVEEAIAALEDDKADASEVTAALGGKSDKGHSHEGETVAPAGISGEVVSREAPITSLSGNTYFVPEGSSDPTQEDGDLVFFYATS